MPLAFRTTIFSAWLLTVSATAIQGRAGETYAHIISADIGSGELRRTPEVEVGGMPTIADSEAFLVAPEQSLGKYWQLEANQLITFTVQLPEDASTAKLDLAFLGIPEGAATARYKVNGGDWVEVALPVAKKLATVTIEAIDLSAGTDVGEATKRHEIKVSSAQSRFGIQGCSIELQKQYRSFGFPKDDNGDLQTKITMVSPRPGQALLPLTESDPQLVLHLTADNARLHERFRILAQPDNGPPRAIYGAPPIEFAPSEPNTAVSVPPTDDTKRIIVPLRLGAGRIFGRGDFSDAVIRPFNLVVESYANTTPISDLFSFSKPLTFEKYLDFRTSSIHLSPDGKVLLASSRSRLPGEPVKERWNVFQLPSGKRIADWQTSNASDAVGFISDGAKVATIRSEDVDTPFELHLSNSVDGNDLLRKNLEVSRPALVDLQTFETSGGAQSVMFSGDGSRLFISISQAGVPPANERMDKVIVYDAQSGAKIFDLEHPATTTLNAAILAVNPNGSRVLLSTPKDADETQLSCWDVASNSSLWTRDVPFPSTVLPVAGNSARFAIAKQGDTGDDIWFYNWGSGEPSASTINPLQFNDGRVSGARVSPDGNKLAVLRREASSAHPGRKVALEVFRLEDGKRIGRLSLPALADEYSMPYWYDFDVTGTSIYFVDRVGSQVVSHWKLP